MSHVRTATGCSVAIAPGFPQARAGLSQATLSQERARALVTQADSVGDTMFLIDLDTYEGSVLSPLIGWRFCSPKPAGG